jgi:preprotein translocase subunit YajC
MVKADSLRAFLYFLLLYFIFIFMRQPRKRQQVFSVCKLLRKGKLHLRL